MTSNTVAAAALATMVLALAAAPADAATKKKHVADPNARVVTVVHPSTRVTVTRRSFLDPGTETLPLNEHYADYAFPPTYTPYPNQGGIVGFWRSPLPSPVDLPGFYNFGR